MSEGQGDDDLARERATVYAITRIRANLPRFLNARASSQEDEGPAKLQTLLDWLGYYQEEPQLLDVHLNDIIPPIIDAFLEHLYNDLAQPPATEVSTGLKDCARLLYHLCKIRGEKVVTRFLSNETRHIQSLLDLLGKRDARPPERDGEGEQVEQSLPEPTVSAGPLTWELRYICFLWLSHLMLAPFSLGTISGPASMTAWKGFSLPHSIPRITADIVHHALVSIEQPTREQKAAANALVKLCLRPDMQAVGLARELVAWAIRNLKSPTDVEDSIHSSIGVLLLLNGVVSSANAQHAAPYLRQITRDVGEVFNPDISLRSEIQGSAVAKRLHIRIQRNVVLKLLQLRQSSEPKVQKISVQLLDEEETLEQMIDLGLKSLSDRDTQVRYAASKALSIVTTSLEPELAEEVVRAVFESLNEDIFEIDGKMNISAANPLRWHGLTLTLSHMLFRRSPTPNQLPEVINGLLMTLDFEQRSTTGSSLGTNVRDAANFGLWSLARKYSTEELSHVQLPSAEKSAEHLPVSSVIQEIACKLLVSACFDLSGNVRRGSSAALQELVGRHPNTIEDGIALVQAVDYQAVGLLERAMTEVSMTAAKLNPVYLDTLINGLNSWRGIRSADTSARRFAASALGRLSELLNQERFMKLLVVLHNELKDDASREVKHGKPVKLNLETRHGLMLSLAQMINNRTSPDKQRELFGSGVIVKDTAACELLTCMLNVGFIFYGYPRSPPEDLMMSTSTSTVRVQLIVEATLSLITSLAICDAIAIAAKCRGATQNTAKLRDMLNVCIKRADRISQFELLISASRAFQLSQRQSKLQHPYYFARTQLALHRAPEATNIVRDNVLTVLSATWHFLPPSAIERELEIVAASNREELPFYADSMRSVVVLLLLDAATSDPDRSAERRAHAVRCMSLVSQSLTTTGDPARSQFLPIILDCYTKALNNYTITERGDVGSHCRAAALSALANLWSPSVPADYPFLLTDPPPSSTQTARVTTMIPCVAAALRISLEKLDKLRFAAAQALAAFDPLTFRFIEPASVADQQSDNKYIVQRLADVSSFEYFLAMFVAGTRYALQPDNRLSPEAFASDATFGTLDAETSGLAARDILTAVMTGIAACVHSANDAALDNAHAALDCALFALPCFSAAVRSEADDERDWVMVQPVPAGGPGGMRSEGDDGGGRGEAGHGGEPSAPRENKEPQHTHGEDSDASTFGTTQGLSVLLFAHILTHALAVSLRERSERTLAPLLETLFFLLDAGLFQTVCTYPFPHPSSGLTPEQDQDQGSSTTILSFSTLEHLAREPRSTRSTHAPLPPPLPFATLLTLVERAHYKSTSLPKLLTCVGIYRHLAEMDPSDFDRPYSAPFSAGSRDSKDTGGEKEQYHAVLAGVRRRAGLKLCSMLQHPYPRVRAAAAKALFIVTEDERMLGFRAWVKVGENKEIVDEVKRAIERRK